MLKQSTTALGSLLLVTTLSHTAFADMPDQSGFSGHIGFGLNGIALKSNMVAGNVIDTISKEVISDLHRSPKSETRASGYINGEVMYTWADSKTQLFIGNSLEDWIRYDFSTELGIRQQYRDMGEFSAALLLPALPTRVWKDPYRLNTKRKETDRKTTGGVLSWNNIMGSHFQVKLSARKIEIDKEESGDSISGLAPAQRHLLSRKGGSRSIEVLYRYSLDSSQMIIPSIKATRYDLDGKAMASDDYLFQLSHVWNGTHWQTVTNLILGKNKHDKANPIQQFNGKSQEDDIYGASFTVFYKEPFHWQNWHAMASIAAVQANSNIDFYETGVTALSAGLLYRF